MITKFYMQMCHEKRTMSEDNGGDDIIGNVITYRNTSTFLTVLTSLIFELQRRQKIKIKGI